MSNIFFLIFLLLLLRLGGFGRSEPGNRDDILQFDSCGYSEPEYGTSPRSMTWKIRVKKEGTSELIIPNRVIIIPKIIIIAIVLRKFTSKENKIIIMVCLKYLCPP